jgi:hypothetical protein
LGCEYALFIAICCYFTDTFSPVLDPRITYAELLADYTEDDDLLEGLEKSKAALYQRFNTVYAPVPDASSSSLHSPHNARLHVPLSS